MRIDTITPREEYLFDIYFGRTLPEWCISLRAALNGAADPIDDKEILETMEYIRLRLDRWTPSVQCDTSYYLFDNAVKEMCIQTLRTVVFHRPDLFTNDEILPIQGRGI